MKSTYLKRTLSAFALFSALSLIVFSFQNCGKGFESISGEVSLSSITPPDSTPVALPYSVSGEDSGRIFTEQTSETYQESVTIVDDLEKGRVFQVAGSLNLTSFGRGAIDTTRIYRISGELKSIGQTPSLVYLGLMPLDEDLEFIQPWHVLRQGNPTRIASIGEGLGGQIEIQTTEELSGWNAATVPGYHRMIGFYLDGDTTKRPDYIHTGIITALTSPQVGAYSSLSGNTIVLNGALPEGFMEELLQSPEAVILNHFSGGTYIYTAAAAVSVGTEWTRFEGLITDEQFNNTNNQFRPDTKWAKISLLANYQQDESAQLQFTNLRLEEVSRDSLDITLVQGLQNQTVPQGQNVTLTATFNGPVDRYTWLRDGNVVAGQNTNTLILTNAQANQSGVYTLRAESFTTSIETSATITIVAPPALATAVGNRIVQELGNITLSAQFTGMGLTYQWFKNNVAIQGQTGLQLTINAATHLDQATYRIEATNLAGSVSSQGNLTVVLLTNGAQLYARDCASCHGNLNNSQKLNRTFDQIRNSMLTVPNMQNRFLVGNALNRTDAQIQAIANALLVVPPTITTQPVSQSRFVGQAVTFSVVASGTNLAYQWRFNGVNIANATNASYTINNVQAGNAGNYSVVVSNSAGSVTSNNALLTVSPLINFTTLPQGLPGFSSLPSNYIIDVKVVNGIIYAATNGGLAISTDGGTSFTTRTTANGLGSNYIYAIDVSGSNVYAATDYGLSISTNGGASFTNRTRSNGLGSNIVLSVYASGSNIYAGTNGAWLSISTDGGASFTSRTSVNGLGNSQVDGVFANGSNIYAVTRGGLYISTNGGTNFSIRTTANGLGSDGVRALFVSGANVYAATGGGLSISTNGGTSFINRTTANGLGSNSLYSVYVSGSNVYAGTLNEGLSVSSDGGASFTIRTTANGLGSNTVGRIFVSGSNVYVSSRGLSISTNGGTSFINRTTTNGLGSNDVRDIFVSGSNVYAATTGGLFISTNGGASFINRINTWVNGVFVSGSNVYAATSAFGLYISTNGGLNFTSRTTANGLGSNRVNGVYVSNSIIYVGTQNGLSISTDNGASFINRTTANGLGGNFVRNVFVSGSNVYTATYGGLSISTNGGTSFTNRTTANGLGSNTVYDVFVSGSNIYVATEGGISISTNGGASFVTRNTLDGLGSNRVFGVFVSGSNIYAATLQGLSVSTNGGTSFTNYTSASGLIGSNLVYSVYVSGANIYAGTTGGLSRSN